MNVKDFHVFCKVIGCSASRRNTLDAFRAIEVNRPYLSSMSPRRFAVVNVIINSACPSCDDDTEVVPPVSCEATENPREILVTEISALGACDKETNQRLIERHARVRPAL